MRVWVCWSGKANLSALVEDTLRVLVVCTGDSSERAAFGRLQWLAELRANRTIDRFLSSIVSSCIDANGSSLVFYRTRNFFKNLIDHRR